MVIDSVIILFVLLLGFLKGKKGLYRSVMPILVLVVSLFIGMVVSEMLVPVVEDIAFPMVEEKVCSKIDDAYEKLMSDTASPGAVFKYRWNGMLEDMGIEPGEVAEDDDDMDLSTPKSVEITKEIAVAGALKTAHKVIEVLLFAIITLAAYLILTLISKMFGGVTEWKVIKWFDAAGGFAIGVMAALVILFIIIRGSMLFGWETFTQYSEGTGVLSMFTGEGELNDLFRAYTDCLAAHGA